MTLLEDPTVATRLDAAVAAVVAAHPVPDNSSVDFLGARYDAGLAWVGQPAGLGGFGVDHRWQPYVDAAFERAGAGPLDPNRNIIALGMAAPTLMSFASPEQQARWLRPLWTGEEQWCQLFSEPGAGSDLAGLATSAAPGPDGDWIVNGQKVWTSLAHIARWGLLLARTDPEVPKHRGLTYFIADMTAPGIEVRPLRQLTGEAEFNEVFLTDVPVRDADRIDAVGRGWGVAVGTLSNERVAFAVEEEERGTGMIARLLEAWEAGPRPAHLVDDLTEQWMEAESLRLLRNRLIQTRAAGPGPEGSAAKLAAAEFQQSAAALWVELSGPDALRYDDWSQRRPVYHDPATRDAGYGFLRSRANAIEGGTSQIMRNIIGERVLGLPAEPRTDRDTPWRELPR